MYCVAFRIDMQNFGSNPHGFDSKAREAVRKDYMILLCFVRFVVTYPLRSIQSHNRTVHVERAIGMVRVYYELMNGRSPCTGRGADFTGTLSGTSQELRKTYPATTMAIMTLLVNDTRSIRKVIDSTNLRYVTYWALWGFQWQGVMRGSDILRQLNAKAKNWMLQRIDTLDA